MLWLGVECSVPSRGSGFRSSSACCGAHLCTQRAFFPAFGCITCPPPLPSLLVLFATVHPRVGFTLLVQPPLQLPFLKFLEKSHRPLVFIQTKARRRARSRFLWIWSLKTAKGYNSGLESLSFLFFFFAWCVTETRVGVFLLYLIKSSQQSCRKWQRSHL